MDRFTPALRKAAHELDLPRPVRAAILMEMAADLEAVFEHHRARGAGEEEAQARAEEAVLGSAEVVRRLGELHQESWRGWSDAIGDRLTGGIDLLLLLVGVLPMVLIAGAVTAATLMADPGSVLVWVLAGIGLALVALLTSEALRLRRDGRARPRRLSMVLVLAGLAPAVGLLAAVLGLYAAFSVMGTGASDGPTAVTLATQLGRDGATLVMGLLLGLAGSLSWFILLNRSRARITRDADLLLGTPTVPAEPRSTDIVPLVRGRSA